MSAVVWLGKAAPSALLRTALTDHRRLHECTHGQQPGTLTRPHAFTGVQRESRTRLTRVIGTAVDCRKTCRIRLHSTSYRGPLHVHLIVPAVCRGSTVYISLHHDVESTSLHHSTVYIPLHPPSDVKYIVCDVCVPGWSRGLARTEPASAEEVELLLPPVPARCFTFYLHAAAVRYRNRSCEPSTVVARGRYATPVSLAGNDDEN